MKATTIEEIWETHNGCKPDPNFWVKFKDWDDESAECPQQFIKDEDGDNMISSHDIKGYVSNLPTNWYGYVVVGSRRLKMMDELRLTIKESQDKLDKLLKMEK